MSDKNEGASVGQWLEKTAIDVGDFFKRNWRPMVKGALFLLAGILTAALGSKIEDGDDDERDQDRPHMPQDAYDKMNIYWGRGKADEWAEMVENGEETVEHAINQANALESFYIETRGRGDIDAEQWNDFEDGWRPGR